MVRILPALIRFRGQPRAFGYFCLILMMGVVAACHPPNSKKSQAAQSAHLSTKDSLLGAQFPLPEHLVAQKDLLYKLSKPAKGVIVPNGESLEGNFGSGTIELIFDEIDGEPFFFYGHLEAPNPQAPMEFIVYQDIPNKLLDKLVPGQKYHVHWIETVVDMEPFDDDRYRYFFAYRIEGN